MAGELRFGLRVVAPTGQYDPAKLVNLGSNRWTFKPELGLSRAFGGHFVLDACGSLWFFTENPEFFSDHPELGTGTQAQTQDPIGAVEVHLHFGGDYKIMSLAWQYSWIDRPK